MWLSIRGNDIHGEFVTGEDGYVHDLNAGYRVVTYEDGTAVKVEDEIRQGYSYELGNDILMT